MDFGDRPVLDPAILRELIAEPGGAEVAGRIAAIFERERRGRLDAVGDALGGGHGPAVAEAAHSIRGSALSIGAARLAALAGAVEEAARAGRLDRAAELRDALDGAYAEAARAVRAEVDRR